MASRRHQTATTAQLKLPLHVASLWLALAVALLSSLMTVGLPRTTVHGSAFNPATTAVALQPRAQPRVVVKTIRRDDDPAPGQGGVVPAAISPVPSAVRPVAAADAPKPAAAPLAVVSRPVLDGSPRGPPLT